jgi:hypothetical protein
MALGDRGLVLGDNTRFSKDPRLSKRLQEILKALGAER